MSKTPEEYLKVEPWSIAEEGYDAEKSRVSESIFSLANEFMGVRGYFEEGYSGDHLLGSYFGGLYENKKVGHPQVFKGLVTEEHFIVNSVDWLYTRIQVGDEQLDLAKCNFKCFVRKTDMKKGLMTREFIWCLKDGREIKIKFERLLSMVNNTLACQRIVLEPVRFTGKVSLCLGLNFDTFHEIATGWNMNSITGSSRKKPQESFWNVLRKEVNGKIYAIEAKTKNTEFSIFSSFQLRSNVTISPETVEKGKFIGCKFCIDFNDSKPVILDKIIVNFWERPKLMSQEEVWHKGITLAKENLKTSYQSALENQIGYWKNKWLNWDIEISSDSELQQGIRFDLFQLHMTYHGGDERLGLPSKGLTGEVYSGWSFWVMESYCQHILIFTDPEVALKLLLFRYQGLQAAIERAKQVDCKGARYPFCTIDGPESCATWQHADMEIHVGLAIFYAIWLYAKHIDAKQFLYNQGIEMLLQICRFYASRGGWSPTKGDFGFYGVMGPDEYHTLVNHNCYTNWMAKKLFNYTLETIAKMTKEAPRELQEVTAKIDLDNLELQQWKLMADNMRIPKDHETGIYEQHDRYFDLPEVDLRKIEPDQIPIYKNWAYEKLFRVNMVKQADVLLLPVWFSHEWDYEEKKANFDFYEPRTIHESSFSPPIHQILAIELGKMKLAYKLTKQMMRLDLDNYNRNTAQGLHITPKSGTWMCVVYGYAGMRTDSEILSFNPVIPEKWNHYKFRIINKGTLFGIEVTKLKILFTKISGADIDLNIYGKNYLLDDNPLEIDLRIPKSGSQKS